MQTKQPYENPYGPTTGKVVDLDTIDVENVMRAAELARETLTMAGGLVKVRERCSLEKASYGINIYARLSIIVQLKVQNRIDQLMTSLPLIDWDHDR